MPDRQAMMLPAAIVIAGGLIGLGLYAGLRPPEVPTTGDAQPSALASSSAAAPQAAPEPQTAPGPLATVVTSAKEIQPADIHAAQQAGNAALQKQRAALHAKCFAPALAQQPLPATVSLTFNVAFDKDGKQMLRGINEDRETSRPAVTQCVQANLPALSIPPPGAVVNVQLLLTLP